jgi:7,8-dihydro-6-hydroxymethylpterin-pyrophosphokinase
MSKVLHTPYETEVSPNLLGNTIRLIEESFARLRDCEDPHRRLDRELMLLKESLGFYSETQYNLPLA